MGELITTYYNRQPDVITPPPDIGDGTLAQWYNGDVPGTVLPKFGNIMPNWIDQSGNARDLTGGIDPFRWVTFKTDGPNGQGYIDMSTQPNSLMYGLNFSSLNNAIGYTLFTVYRTNTGLFQSAGYIQSLINSGVTPSASSFRLNFFGLHVGNHRRLSTDPVVSATGLLGATAVNTWAYDIITVDTVNQVAKIYPNGVLDTTTVGFGTAGNMEAVNALQYHLGRKNFTTSSNDTLYPDIAEAGVWSKELSEFEVNSQLKSYADTRYNFVP